jgi:hypothetical protein
VLKSARDLLEKQGATIRCNPIRDAIKAKILDRIYGYSV